MPEILPDHAPSPRTPIGWDKTRYQAFRIHTDGTVQVRGEDQLFSFKDRYYEGVDIPNAVAGNNTLSGSSPVPGIGWIVTNVAAHDTSNAITEAHIEVFDGAVFYWLAQKITLAAREIVSWSGKVVLRPGDLIRARLDGCTLNDHLYLYIAGYKMTLET